MREYKKFLKTFLIPRIIKDNEFNRPEIKKAVTLGDIHIGMVFHKDKFYATGSLTDSGYEYFLFGGIYRLFNRWRMRG